MPTWTQDALQIVWTFLRDKELNDLARSLGPIAKRQIDTLYNHIIKAVDELNGCT